MICRMTDLVKSMAKATVVGSDALDPSPALLNGSTVLTGLHARVLDLLGLAICAGDLASGSVVRIDQLQKRYGVSRSVMREQKSADSAA